MTKYMTTEEVAEYLRTSVDTVRYWHHRGTGPASVKLGRRRLYAIEDVEAWIAKQREAVPA
ncbi:AlpA family transcriptional regulator [Demequina sp. NBRC 110053]|uniref:helix-turn-helix transcriptional regulator n=1 Tax=Demequina sp. NBRC 110053 TaxID=1570342 RepID=UPI000A04FDC7|nr:helix-turn-helix domain-containing protein [Demequina sp. NBRC 110053]